MIGLLCVATLRILEDLMERSALVYLNKYLEDVLGDVDIVFIDSCPFDDFKALVIIRHQFVEGLPLHHRDKLLYLFL